MKRWKGKFLVLAAVSVLFAGYACKDPDYIGQAAEERSGLLRIIATGDLHGQVTPWDYETDCADETVGLSRLSTIVKKAKEEAGESNSILVDAGDMLYNYSVRTVYEYNRSALQPIFQAMSLMEYDAITLGNHEFDYPFDYVKSQLLQSGLYNKTTVCNLFYDDNGEDVLAPHIIVEKQIVASDGNKVTVKVGIVGATRDGLSTKRQRYSGYLCTQDIYTNVKEEAKLLKEMGADVVVAVVHGGIGVLSGSDTQVHPGARLCMLPEIDAVVTAHTHETFPLNDGTYQSYPTVDEINGCINKTPILATGSYAHSIGWIDLQLKIDSTGNISVTGGAAKVAGIEESTGEDKAIATMFKKYQKVISRSIDSEQYPLADDIVLTNADCVASDTALFQLFNNAKIRYGTSYIQEFLPKYKDYPVIAVTVNDLDNKQDYIMITDSITERDVSAVLSESSSERDSGYIYLYKITGKNLREWVEYSASIYAKKGTRFTTILPSFTKKNAGVSTLLNESQLEDWSGLFVFDGIDYEIDLTQGARYNANGTFLSSRNKRIVNLTYQGQEVTDTMEFIIVSDAYHVGYSFLPVGSDSIYNLFPWNNGKDIVMDYIRELSEYGPISIEPDHNWRFAGSEGYEFAFGTMYGSLDYGKAADWYYKHVSGPRIGLQFYWGRYQTPSSRLNVVLSLGITKPTCLYIPVTVSIVSLEPGSEISSILYRRGRVSSVDDAGWSIATKVNDYSFNVSDNGIYSVLVIDSLGNKKISYITVDSIDHTIIDTPTLDLYTNRKRALTGVAIPSSTIHVKTEDGTEYTQAVKADGSFSVTLPVQRPESKVTVWVSEGTRNSEKTDLYVYRTGPNPPTFTDVNAGNVYVKGLVGENEVPFVVVDKVIYMGTGMRERYMKSDFYNPDWKISEAEIIFFDENMFLILTKMLNKGSNVYLYSLDWQNRGSLRVSYTVR